MNQVVAEKLRDFADDGIPEAFESCPIPVDTRSSVSA